MTMCPVSVRSVAALSVEGGANGALAHLTTSLPARKGASSRRRALPGPLVQLALSSWSHRKLVGLARLAEAHVAQAGEGWETRSLMTQRGRDAARCHRFGSHGLG